MGHAVENGWADEVFEGGADVVFFTFGNSAGEDDEIGLGEGLFDSCLGGLEVIGEMMELDLCRSPGVYGGGQGEAVGLAELIGKRRLVRWNEFVAGAEDGDFWESGDEKMGGSNRGGHT